MPLCIRCGKRFKSPVDSNKVVCPECEEFEYERGLVRCCCCGMLCEPEEVVGGLCAQCVNEVRFDEDKLYEQEVISYEELEEDELEDDFDN